MKTNLQYLIRYVGTFAISVMKHYWTDCEISMLASAYTECGLNFERMRYTYFPYLTSEAIRNKFYKVGLHNKGTRKFLYKTLYQHEDKSIDSAITELLMLYVNK